jgi:advillin
MIDPAFVGAGAKVGLELWRIEELKPVRQSTVNGKFFTGDSYILLNTYANSTGKLFWNIHFWLGAETTLDESGVAAYKSVELDDALGGRPVQYREVQGEESQAFLSIFKNTGGIEYLPGGIDSGFQKVERDVYKTRLLHLKGQRTVRVSEVPLQLASLNRGDVFILDAGLKIYVFNGPSSNKYEKAKGLEVTVNINSDQRGGRAEIILVHENPSNEEFWGYFGGYHDPETLPEGESDEIVHPSNFVTKLFTISDATGSIVFEPVPLKDGKLRREYLIGDDISLLHTSNKV